jgi:hypothetical protein
LRWIRNEFLPLDQKWKASDVSTSQDVVVETLSKRSWFQYGFPILMAYSHIIRNESMLEVLDIGMHRPYERTVNA